MPLATGTRLGPYEILCGIGAGGMGEVYRATDTKLKRQVAVKILPSVLAADPDRLARFQREAEVLATLNHPHIAAIYGLEEADGVRALVLELVEGEDLLQRIARGAIPVAEALPIAKQIAEALEAAHEQGIIHRDLKPANIKVRSDGTVKVLDFGLAKALEPTGTMAASESMSATITTPAMTQAGMILGTAAYMSPEQAKGRPVDKRSDVWSFGAVLFEMLSGRRAFYAEDVSDTLAAVLMNEPDWTALPATVPPTVVTVLRRCLQKNAKQRIGDVQDVRLALEGAFEATAPQTPPSATSATPRGRLAWMVALAGAAVVVIVALAIPAERYLRLRETPRAVVQFDIPSPAGTIFTPQITRQPFAMSPDGKRLAFTATDASGSKLWIRDLASPEMHAVPGTADVWSMYWAPDSRSIYFSVRKTLKQVNPDTGSLRTVAELANMPMLASWRPNGDMLLFMGAGELWELHPSDGSVRKGKAIEGIRWPQFLPGSDRLIYVVHDNATHVTHLLTADYMNPRPLILTQSDARGIYSAPVRSGAPGYLLFIRGGDLLAQRFDPDRLQLSGEPIPVAQNVIYFPPNLGASISVSDNGVLAYQTGFPSAELKWYDRSGNEGGKVGPPLPHWGNVRFSRDGRRVAATVWSANLGQSVWMFDADGKNSRQFSFPPNIDLRPVWSPDGTKLAIGTSLNGGPQLGLIDAGGGSPEMFPANPGTRHLSLPTDWSRDGRFVAVDDGVGEEQHNAWIADVANRKMTPLLQNSFAQWGVAFAPDVNVKQIAFVSTESGRPEVYLQGFEETPEPRVVGERRQVSRDGAWLVRWKADGRELFFLGLDNEMNAAQVQGLLQFGEPKGLFRMAGVTQYATTRDFQFDVSPDGQRFIFPTTGSVPPPPFTVIENFQEKFRK